MTLEEAFALQLIAAEENQLETAADGGQTQGSRSEVIPIERENFTATSGFAFNQPGTTMPIDGPGTLIEAVLVAQSEDFDVTVELDDRRVVGEAFATLRGRADELERLSAYQRSPDDNFVFIAAGYEFQRHVNVTITPTDTSLDVVLQRAEVDVVR